MPSSTSNSEAFSASRRGLIASAALLGMLMVVSACIELGCRFAIPRVSRIERRMETEHAALLAAGESSPQSVRAFVIGNSLLGEGLRFEDARRNLQPEIDLKRFLVEDTCYFDWKYGLRRLLAEGARPDVVVMVMTARQLISPRIRGDYFAYHLMTLGDLPAVAGETDASNTRTGDLAFGNLSAFGGMRSELRKLFASALVPDLQHLTSLMTAQSVSPMDPNVVCGESARRLFELKQLLQQYNSRFILVIPPEGTKASETMASAVQEAGTRASVSVLVPVVPGSLPARLFADGFHLNEQGARVFTPNFVESLRAEILPKMSAVADNRPPQTLKRNSITGQTVAQ
jgi:hypothetical protein